MMNNTVMTFAQQISGSAARILFIYLIIVNVVAFITMGVDKFKAVKHLFRIPEKVLFLEALIGGVVGSLLGMYVFHHKVRKWKFRIGMPAILIFYILIALFMFSSSQIQFL